LKLNPLIISEKYHSPSKDKSAGSRVSTSKSKGKSPLIWHNEETVILKYFRKTLHFYQKIEFLNLINFKNQFFFL